MNSDKIRISVKGNEEQAREAMKTRGVPGEFAGGNSHDRTFWDVPPSSRAKIVAWFCEAGVCDPSKGFPPGTLLHHS